MIAHTAAAHRSAHGSRAHRAGARPPAGRAGRLPGSVQRPGERAELPARDDGRHSAGRDADRPLPQCRDTIILDEAHERSLNIDFLLGYVKRLLPTARAEVVITSATIDAERFRATSTTHR
jgi:ATP-dependent helicase HrpA